jgi:hypothetical protein
MIQARARRWLGRRSLERLRAQQAALEGERRAIARERRELERARRSVRCVRKLEITKVCCVRPHRSCCVRAMR